MHSHWKTTCWSSIVFKYSVDVRHGISLRDSNQSKEDTMPNNLGKVNLMVAGSGW